MQDVLVKALKKTLISSNPQDLRRLPSLPPQCSPLAFPLLHPSLITSIRVQPHNPHRNLKIPLATNYRLLNLRPIMMITLANRVEGPESRELRAGREGDQGGPRMQEGSWLYPPPLPPPMMMMMMSKVERGNRVGRIRREHVTHLHKILW